MSFQAHNTINPQKIKPKCPSCPTQYDSNGSEIRAEVTLIDVVADWNNSSSTVPVFQCQKCSKIFGNREWEVQNAIDQSHYNDGVNDLANISNFRNGLYSHHDFKEAVRTEIRNNHEPNHVTDEIKRRIDHEIKPILDDLKTRIAEAEKLAADPLHDLRKRVNSFELQ